MKHHVISLLILVLTSGASYGQTCYHELDDASGMDRSTYNNALNVLACQVRTAMDDFSDDFGVYDFGYYSEVDGYNDFLNYDVIFERAKGQITHPYYLLFAKQSDFRGIYTEIRVELKLPATGIFASLTPALLESAQEMVRLATMEEYEKNGNVPSMYNYAEYAGMNKLLKIIDQIKEGTFGFNEETLTLNGFIELPFDGGEFQRTGNDDLGITHPGIFDYAGMEHMAGGFASTLEQAKGAIQSLPFAVTTIFTDNENAFSASNEFETANGKYEGEYGSDVVLWLHFYEEVDSGGVISRPAVTQKLYVKYKSNISPLEAESIIEDLWSTKYKPVPIDTSGTVLRPAKQSATGCYELSWEWRAKNCMYDPTIISYVGDGFSTGLTAGMIDGVIGLVACLVDVGSAIEDTLTHTLLSIPWFKDLFNHIRDADSFFKGLVKKWNYDKEWWQDTLEQIQKFLDLKVKDVLQAVKEQMEKWWGNITGKNGTIEMGYNIGILAFEVVLSVLTGGIAATTNAVKTAAQVTRTGINRLSKLASKADIKALLANGWSQSGALGKKLKCAILVRGCFVKDTPVLMANKNYNINFENTAKFLVVAAGMPIVAVPIQEVQLLDYAVAHETVNATYGMTANADEQTFFLDKDPYTSDEQRERDLYDLDDENWNEVVFEEVYGNSTAKLALHKDWIDQKGYRQHVIVNMNLPEQGINGPFRITSIKHILPPKKPEADAGDGYDYRPVTGLFTHTASDVWKIKFDNGEELGVTHNHPVYSTTIGDWQFAGMLQIGEEVLTKDAGAKVVSKEIDKAQEVYNLEVKDLHNFLVGESGVVVHNSCWDLIGDIFETFGVAFERSIKLSGKNWTYKVRSTDNPLPKEITFSEEIGSEFQKRIALAPESTVGFDAVSEHGRVMSYKVMEGQSVNSNLSQLKDNLSQAINKYKSKFGDKGIEVDIYVRGEHLTKQAALDNWGLIKDTNVPYTANLGIIGKIYYKGPDGFIEFN